LLSSRAMLFCLGILAVGYIGLGAFREVLWMRKGKE
jgi:hypothetical protein